MIVDGKKDILTNQSHVAKSWLDRKMLSNLVSDCALFYKLTSLS